MTIISAFLYFAKPDISNCPCNSECVIYFHSSQSSKDKRANEIMKVLSNCDCKVEGIEKVNTKTDKNMIKYFHSLDKNLAEELVLFVKEKTGIELKITYNPNYAYKVDRKYLEIWLK